MPDKNTLTIQQAKKFIDTQIKTELFSGYHDAYCQIKKELGPVTTVEQLVFFLQEGYVTPYEHSEGDTHHLAPVAQNIIDTVTMKDLYEWLPQGAMVFYLEDRWGDGVRYGYLQAIVYDKYYKCYQPYSITEQVSIALDLPLKKIKGANTITRDALQWSKYADITGLMHNLSKKLYNREDALKWHPMNW